MDQDSIFNLNEHVDQTVNSQTFDEQYFNSLEFVLFTRRMLIRVLKSESHCITSNTIDKFRLFDKSHYTKQASTIIQPKHYAMTGNQTLPRYKYFTPKHLAEEIYERYGRQPTRMYYQMFLLCSGNFTCTNRRLRERNARYQ
jgi:hypothetical protein